MPSASFGRLGRGRRRRFGTLDVEFLADPGPRGRLEALRIRMAPSAEHAPLRHDRTTEFFLVIKGSLEARIGGRARRLRKGDHCLLPPGVPHAFRAGPRGVEVLSIFSPPLDLRRPDIVYEEADA